MAARLPLNGYILGLDVGEKRIGAALTSVVARLPQPQSELKNDETVFDKISDLVKKEGVTLIVVGLPRNLSGEETAQSEQIRKFAKQLSDRIGVPVTFADESLSSVRADKLVRENTFKNVSQDSLAACFILEEFLNTAEV